MTAGDIGLAFGTVLILALGLIGGAYMVIGMLGMLLNRELSVGEFLVWLLAFGGLLSTTVALSRTPLFPLLALLTLSLALAAPLSSWLVDRLGMQRLRQEDLLRYLQGTQTRPDIPYNFRKLGDLFYQSGDWALAAEYYEQAQKILADARTAFMLEKARERAALGRGEPRVCPDCGRLNPARARECLHCGAMLPGAHELLLALGQGRGRLWLLLTASTFLAGGIALCLLRVGPAAVDGLLLVLGVGAAVLYFCALKVLAPGRLKAE
jgi:tetratricopeptide (TPR) repeat protein